MLYDELMNVKKNICIHYLDHYNKKGYEIAPPLPLSNKEDISLDFTTCTICTAKDNIKKNKKGRDYVMIQPALRNTHLDVLGKIQGDDYFFSFFSMMGGFKYCDTKSNTDVFSSVIKNEFDFLKKYADKIVMTIPKQYIDKMEINEKTIDYLTENNCEIKISNNDEKNLKWKYGLKDVVGYGTRWEISNGGDLVNWGNTINVYKKDKPVGVDFGGGVESLIYANLKLKNSIYANDAMTDSVKLFCEKGSLYEKSIDCIISSMCIIANKDKFDLRSKQLLKSYMKKLYALMLITGINTSDITNIINDINKRKIPFLNDKEMKEKFEEHFLNAVHNYSIISKSKNIDDVVKLFDMCYNPNNNWVYDKKVLNSHFCKYFTNLSEVELLSLKKKKEDPKIYEKTKKTK